MVKAADNRITTRGTFVKKPSTGANKKKSAVDAKKPLKKKALKFDAFADSYFDTAIFADRPEDCEADDVWPACIPAILEDCYRFQEENRELLESAYELTRDDGGERRLYDVTDAGHDFWLSRNGHGTGFWDRGLGEIGDKLHEAARACGGVDVLPGEGKQKYWLFIE